MTATEREVIVVQADCLSEYELVPLPIPGGEAPLARAIRDGARVVVRGAGRATPQVLRRLYELAGFGPEEVIL